ncbi:MAG: hypothetical protein F4X40_09725 [Chloroflexi bacterium]|nr:hypothetical protein [Chloroflexota bacterium]
MGPQTNRSLHRAVKVFTATFAVAIIALAPAFAVSIFAPDSMGEGSGTDPHVSTIAKDETDAVETVLVVDPKIKDDLSDEFTATKDPNDETESREFTIIVDVDDVEGTNILDGSDYITITLENDYLDGRLQPTWINSGCSIYVGPYDSQDSERTGLYSTYEGSVKVLDEESRSISDDCTLYWIDNNEADW